IASQPNDVETATTSQHCHYTTTNFHRLYLNTPPQQIPDTKQLIPDTRHQTPPSQQFSGLCSTSTTDRLVPLPPSGTALSSAVAYPSAANISNARIPVA
ncbi:hypothetical protein CCHR01_07368, partial [Colletotrichum chrysophilum]